MARKRYCDCGRKIVTRINGKYKQSRDNDHVLCRQCWQVQRDREQALVTPTPLDIEEAWVADMYAMWKEK